MEKRTKKLGKSKTPKEKQEQLDFIKLVLFDLQQTHYILRGRVAARGMEELDNSFALILEDLHTLAEGNHPVASSTFQETWKRYCFLSQETFNKIDTLDPTFFQ